MARRVTHVAAAADEQLERVVEHRRVRARLVEDGAIRVVVGPAERASRARIQLTLPWIALISPLWQRSRNGCARSHDGVVFVEKRWWKIPNGTASRGVAEVGVEGRELVGGAERLVGDRAEGERGDVERPASALRGGARGRRGARPRRRRRPRQGGGRAARSAGALARAPGPSADGSTGTSRQPNGSMPFVAAAPPRPPPARPRRAGRPWRARSRARAAAPTGAAAGRPRRPPSCGRPRSRRGGGRGAGPRAGGRRPPGTRLPVGVRDEADATGIALGGEIVE